MHPKNKTIRLALLRRSDSFFSFLFDLKKYPMCQYMDIECRIASIPLHKLISKRMRYNICIYSAQIDWGGTFSSRHVCFGFMHLIFIGAVLCSQHTIETPCALYLKTFTRNKTKLNLSHEKRAVIPLEFRLCIYVCVCVCCKSSDLKQKKKINDEMR